MPVAVSRNTRSARAAAAAECVTSKQAAPSLRTWATSKSSMRPAVAGSRDLTPTFLRMRNGRPDPNVFCQRFPDPNVSQRARLRREKLGFVFQAFHLLPHLSVSENVALLLLPLWASPTRRGWLRCWPQWAWPGSHSAARRSSQAASCSTWRWRARWCTGHC